MKKGITIGYSDEPDWMARHDDIPSMAELIRREQERAVDLCELSIMKYLEGAGQDHHKAGIRAAINRMRQDLWRRNENS